MKTYILEEKEPKAVDDIIEWSKWYEKADRRVKKTQLNNDIYVSTVFLGLDHSYDEGTPILFETMIFGGEHDGFQNRYATWDEAEKGHDEAVKIATS